MACYCDGTNGTPDLRNRFILSVEAGEDPGPTGGAHALTLTTSQMPGHGHNFSTSLTGSHRHPYLTVSGNAIQVAAGFFAFPAGAGLVTGATSFSGNHTHSGTTAQVGGNSSFDNRPAYYTLAFIMRL